MEEQQAAKVAATGRATANQGSPGHPAKVDRQLVLSPWAGCDKVSIYIEADFEEAQERTAPGRDCSNMGKLCQGKGSLGKRLGRVKNIRLS